MLRIELTDRLAQCGVRGSYCIVASVQHLLHAGEDRAVEGEIFAGHALGQHARIVLNQVKSEVVLPRVEVFTAYQSGSSGHARRLPNDEFRLPDNTG